MSLYDLKKYLETEKEGYLKADNSNGFFATAVALEGIKKEIANIESRVSQLEKEKAKGNMEWYQCIEELRGVLGKN